MTIAGRGGGMRAIADDEAEAIAIQALAFLARDGERIGRFMVLTGIDFQDLRAAASSEGFLAGVLDHLMGDESLLAHCAEELGLTPERIAAAHRQLLATTGTEA